MKKKIMALFVAVLFILSALPVSASAEGFSDTQKHWAKNAVERWNEAGVINGYHGRFRPDDYITRGDMAVIIDNLMKYRQESENTYSDLPAGAYYTPAVLRCTAAGVMNGSAGKARAQDYITREQAMVMLGRALHIDEAEGLESYFYDVKQVGKYAYPILSQMCRFGYIKGYSDETLRPKKNITRAEVVSLLNEMVALYISEPGVYTSDTVLFGEVLVAAADVTLKDMEIRHNLLISPGAAGGSTKLENVYVDQKMTVLGSRNVFLDSDTQVFTLSFENQTDDGMCARAERGAFIPKVYVEENSTDILFVGDFSATENFHILSKWHVTLEKAAVGAIHQTGPASLYIDGDSTAESITVYGPGNWIGVAGTVKDHISLYADNIIIGTYGTAKVNMVNVLGHYITIEGEAGVGTAYVLHGDNVKITVPNTVVIVEETAGDVVTGGGMILESPGEYVSFP